MRWIAMSALLIAIVGLKLAFMERKDLALLPRKGVSPPVFELRTLDGAPYNISAAYKNRRSVVVLFWATWCAPCRRELQAFKEAHEELARLDVEVVAINAKEPEDVVRRYVTSTELPFPVLLDPDERVRAQFGVSALPTSITIIRGKVQVSMVGFHPDYLPRLMDMLRVGQR